MSIQEWEGADEDELEMICEEQFRAICETVSPAVNPDGDFKNNLKERRASRHPSVRAPDKVSFQANSKYAIPAGFSEVIEDIPTSDLKLFF